MHRSADTGAATGDAGNDGRAEARRPELPATVLSPAVLLILPVALTVGFTVEHWHSCVGTTFRRGCHSH